MQPQLIGRWRTACRTVVPALRRCARFLPSAAVLSLAVGVVVGVSCTTVNRTVIAPPQIAGAKYVGSDTCAQCHAGITKDFPTASHARLKAAGANAANVGCESCHGPASLHNESGGARGTIVNPRKSPDTCFQCHLEVQGMFRLPNHHPVPEGKVSCADCHNPHKGKAVAGGTAIASEVDTCGKCHIPQRGPFTFEHEAVREGCTTCHSPHGSVNARMLTERNAILCLKCHFQEQHADGKILIGGQDHTTRLARGTCWSGGCHEAVHGSHVGSSLRF